MGVRIATRNSIIGLSRGIVVYNNSGEIIYLPTYCIEKAEYLGNGIWTHSSSLSSPPPDVSINEYNNTLLGLTIFVDVEHINTFRRADYNSDVPYFVDNTLYLPQSYMEVADLGERETENFGDDTIRNFGLFARISCDILLNGRVQHINEEMCYAHSRTVYTKERQYIEDLIEDISTILPSFHCSYEDIMELLRYYNIEKK